MEQGVTLDTSYKTPIKFEMAPEEKLRTSVVDKGHLLKKNAIIEKLMEKAIIEINCNSLEKKQQQRLTTWLLFWPTF